MIGYVTLGTNDLERGSKFYDELLALVGAARFMETDRFVAWGVSPTDPFLGLIKPYDGKEACVGNGVMVALHVDSTEKVDEVYNKALALGGTCEGAPGKRNDQFYAGYFRDLEGNKLNVFTMLSPD